VNIREYYVGSKWFCKGNGDAFDFSNNVDFCNLLYESNVARSMIEESKIEYDCIATIRSDLAFYKQKFRVT
jgi:hypothetical protein